MDVCPFCHPALKVADAPFPLSGFSETSPINEDVIARNNLCYALWDNFPVNKGHALVIPFRHTPDFFSLTQEERAAVCDLVVVCREIIDREFVPDGYNIGFNVGGMAGQTIFHCHCHVIPRYVGDVPEPKGGVRGVVPERRGY